MHIWNNLTVDVGVVKSVDTEFSGHVMIVIYCTLLNMYTMLVCTAWPVCSLVYTHIYHLGTVNDTLEDFNTTIDVEFSSRTLNLDQGFVDFTDSVYTILPYIANCSRWKSFAVFTDQLVTAKLFQ